jgi:hypothetical protein
MQLLQSLSEDEPNRQTEIHEWVENKLLEWFQLELNKRVKDTGWRNKILGPVFFDIS